MGLRYRLVHKLCSGLQTKLKKMQGCVWAHYKAHAKSLKISSKYFLDWFADHRKVYVPNGILIPYRVKLPYFPQIKRVISNQ